METQKPSFTLDDSVADSFYESSDGAYVTQPFAASPPGIQTSASSRIEQFEVDDSAVSRLALKAQEYTDASRYTDLFNVNVSDVVGRILRGCLPLFLGKILSPPPAQVARRRQRPSHDPDEGGDVEFDASGEENDVQDASAASPEVFADSVASPEPFNEAPDLYGPVWISFTLIIAISAGANAYAMLRSVVRGHDAFYATRLSGADFANFATASSYVWMFLLISSASVVLLKRYFGDPDATGPAEVVCVYGYSMAPLVPAVTFSALGESVCLFSLSVASCLSAMCVLINLWPKTNFVPSFLSGHTNTSDEETATVADISSYGSPDAVSGVPERSAVFWLRMGVVCWQLLAGFVLKFRFF